MTEKEFQRKLSKVLNEKGYMVVPIESKATMCGIPDLWVAGQEFRGWVELKRVHSNGDPEGQEFRRIKFEPGQQAFAYNLHKVTEGKETVTVLVCYNNGIGQYRWDGNNNVLYKLEQWHENISDVGMSAGIRKIR